MKSPYQLLAQRVRDEVADISLVAEATLRHWRRLAAVEVDQDVYLNSVALNLHSFYSGVERVLELIALELDGGTLGGRGWHAELLRQMATDAPNVRPPVLCPQSTDWLSEYRKFRHRVRNIYATNLLPERMESLVEGLPAGWDRVRQELLAVAEFLEQLASSEE